MQVRSRSDSLVVSFTYDAAGNRIAKQVATQGAELTTVVTRYLRDASGNVLAIYEDSVMIEQPIYGSNRLGMYTGGKIAAHRNMGTKRYELSNHLGNVMTVITDNIGMEQDSVWASVVSTSDYYPFGLGMGGRSFSDSTYRYGFNGKEQDSNGEFGLTHYDYGFRIYNTAIGKFLSVDPLTRNYPMLTPYQFASNRPIDGIDLDGLEFYKASHYTFDLKPKVFSSNEVVASLFVDPITQQVNYLQAAAKHQRRLGIKKGQKTKFEAVRTLAGIGTKFGPELGISGTTNLGKSIKGIGRVNALYGIYTEFEKAYKRGGEQGEALNHSIVVNLLQRDFERAEWVLDVISTAQKEGIVKGDQRYLTELLNFSLKGKVPTIKRDDQTFSFLIDEEKLKELRSDFSKLEEFVERDKERIDKIDIGNNKTKIISFRKLKPKPK